MRSVILMAALILATLGLVIACGGGGDSGGEGDSSSDTSSVLVWDEGNWDETKWQ